MRSPIRTCRVSALARGREGGSLARENENGFALTDSGGGTLTPPPRCFCLDCDDNSDGGNEANVPFVRKRISRGFSLLRSRTLGEGLP